MVILDASSSIPYIEFVTAGSDIGPFQLVVSWSVGMRRGEGTKEGQDTGAGVGFLGSVLQTMKNFKKEWCAHPVGLAGKHALHQ